MAEYRCTNTHDRCYQGGPCPYCERKTVEDEHGEVRAICAECEAEPVDDEFSEIEMCTLCGEEFMRDVEPAEVGS